MPQSPYALLRASINGAAVQTGGITVPASATVQLSADPGASVGVTQYKYEIYGYPSGFACPSGWTTVGANYVYNSSATPPIFTLPTTANWGKFMLRLTVNNAISTNTVTIPVSQLIDETTALSLLSPNGLADVGLFETNQFAVTWVPPVQASLRAIDTAVTSVAGANAKPPAVVLGSSNLTLSGEQTIDGVLTSASRVLLVAQSSSAQNGLWVTAAGAWTRPTDFASDGQVVVGQTVFITSGSLNSHTNWQLVSGSSIAGAKSYSQLLNGAVATIILPVDAVDTTNNALSGTTAVDGVTLTAATSRVLVVNQTTASQNGPWLVQAGAWSRPTDFAVDSQVVVGSVIAVKSGTLGAGTNWRLDSGSAISGAKAFSRVLNGRLAPVRVVQVQALTAHTVAATTLTATANGALDVAVFDLPSTGSYAVGDRLEVNTQLVAHARNGIYTVTQIGSGGTPWILTRATDLDSSSDIVGGASYDVIDGNTFKGSRRQLFTQGTVTLGTTAILFDAVRERPLTEWDLSKPPYNIRGYTTDALAAGHDYSQQLAQALYDCAQVNRASGSPVGGGGIVLKLPHGLIPIQLPVFDDGGNFRLRGGGRQASILLMNGLGGGPGLYVGKPIIPAFAGGAISAGGSAIPFTSKFFVNLSMAGQRWRYDTPYTADSQFDCRVWFKNITVPAQNSHIVSTRGFRTHTNAAAIGMHQIQISSGVVNAKLRTIDPMVIQASGTAPPTVTLTGTPIHDGVPLHIEIQTATTFRYSLNMGFTWYEENLVPTTGSLAAGGTYTLKDRATGCVVNFSAGTYGSTQRYTNVQTTNITSVTAASGTTKSYEIAHTYDGATTRLAVNNITDNTADALPQSSAQTGKVVAFPYEETVLGTALNDSYGTSGQTYVTADIYFGGISFAHTATTAARAPASAEGGNLPIGATGLTCWFVPYDDNNIAIRGKEPTSPTVKGWRVVAGGVTAYVVPGYNDDNFTPNWEISDLSIDTRTSPTNAITMISPTAYSVHNIEIITNAGGIFRFGSSFLGSFRNLRIVPTTYGICVINGEFNLSGYNVISGGEIQACFAGCGGYIDKLFCDGQGRPDTGILFNAVTSTRCGSISVSDESTATSGQSYAGGLVVASVNDGYVLEIEGILGCVSTTSPSLILDGSTVDKGRILVGSTINSVVTAPRTFVVTDDAIAHGVPYVELTRPFQLRQPGLGYANRPEYFIRTQDKPIDNAVALTDASATIKRSSGQWFRMPANTTTANRSVTISPSEVVQGQVLRVTVLSQGNDVTIFNGGPAGGVLDAAKSSKSLRSTYANSSPSFVPDATTVRRVYYFNGTDWEIYS